MEKMPKINKVPVGDSNGVEKLRVAGNENTQTEKPHEGEQVEDKLTSVLERLAVDGTELKNMLILSHLHLYKLAENYTRIYDQLGETAPSLEFKLQHKSKNIYELIELARDEEFVSSIENEPTQIVALAELIRERVVEYTLKQRKAE